MSKFFFSKTESPLFMGGETCEWDQHKTFLPPACGTESLHRLLSKIHTKCGDGEMSCDLVS